MQEISIETQTRDKIRRGESFLFMQNNRVAQDTSLRLSRSEAKFENSDIRDPRLISSDGTVEFPST